MMQRDPSADTSSFSTCYEAGVAALESDDLETARSWLERCEALPGGASDSRCLALHGLIAAGAGDIPEAVSHFRRALARGGERGPLVRQAVEALVEAGALPEAIALLEEVADRAPRVAAPLVDLAHLRLLHGDRAGAREVADRALALRPEEPAVGWSVARIYEALGEPGLAAETLARSSGAAPSPRLLGDMARLHLELKQPAAAERHFRALKALDPDHELVAQHGLTWCRIQARDWRGALTQALDATRLDRLDLTTEFLAYARDRLFGDVPDAARRERELAERFLTELREHDELHAGEIPLLRDESEGGNRG